MARLPNPGPGTWDLGPGTSLFRRPGTSFVLRVAAVIAVVVAIETFMTRPLIARILVIKSERVLRLLDAGGGVVAEYPIIFGQQGVGTKEIEGDRRTPEGEYLICVKNPESKFHLSLGLNYPNA